MKDLDKLSDGEFYEAERTAANTFKELAPQYVPCQHNWRILRAEMLKRPNVLTESIDVLSYLEAYEAVKDKLLLKVLDEEPPELTERDIENMPSEEYKRRVVIPEFQAAQRGRV
jgi:hypothetical protein